jgi:hypothetical protein
MGMNHLQLHYPYDTPSGATTPWHERAPLFAHECLGLNEGGEEEESPITSESVESPTKPEPEEEVIDPNDPLLEPFPEDCMSILTHIRSCESRMSEDETNVHGVPPSPITKPKSRSSSIETPGSARLDAQPSPALDVIAEEHHEEDSYFGGLPGPSQKVQGAEEVRVPEELNVIHEVEEPAEDPKTVLDNLQKIEEATGDSNKIAVKDESAETTEVEERMPVEDSGMAEERNMTDATSEQMKEPTEAKESLKLETMDSADDSQTGLTAIEVQTDPEDYVVREDHHADLEELSAPEQTSDMAEHVQDPPEQVHDDLVNFVGKDHLEHAHDNLVNLVGQHQPEDGPVPEIPVEPKSDFTEQENANAGSSDVERKEDFQQNSKLLHAEDDEEPQNVAVDKQSILVQPSEPGPIADPQLAEPKGEAPEDEKPNDDLKEIMQPQWNNELQQHDGHLQSVEEEPRHVDESRKMAEPTQLSEPKQAEESQLDSINGISMGGAIMKDLPAESTAEVRDVEQAASWQGLTQERDVLGSDAHQSAIALENPHPEAERSVEADLPISQTNADEELPPAPEHDVLGSKSRIENASEVETSHEANLPISQIKADDEIAPIHVEAVTSGANDVDEVEETLPNGVDTAKSTSVDAPSPNGHDNDTKLTPRKTATPNIERPLTPSIRSPMKVPESENFLKAIWRTVFVEWLGGIIAHLCGGERGP